jgi:transposase-like protein
VSFLDIAPSIQLEEADGSCAVSSNQKGRVDTRRNAPMTPGGRLRTVQAVLAGERVASVARRFGIDLGDEREALHEPGITGDDERESTAGLPAAPALA